ncbi:hypothetical protein SynROS8604_00216 [Synechococcus sp. ROS8604]|nr:hypothetical protein SynROS8604_00216 [Synechococcus sp. ROS8604]
MKGGVPEAEAVHAQALSDLEAGKPLAALKAWRHLLLSDAISVGAHLHAASATLNADVIAPLRRQAIALTTHLLHHEPGETEINQLGRLLRGWGTLALPEVPSRALQLLERAWSCGRDPALDQQLATLHARIGYGSGAHWLAEPPAELEPWPLTPCATQHCQPCQQQSSANAKPLQLRVFSQGRLWVQRQRNPWHQSHGVAVVDHHGAYQSDLCRHYPWPWPSCPHLSVFEQVAELQLKAAESELALPKQLGGPVLAIAELSGEMFFHWQMELLPRLGRCWTTALAQWPNLRLWHNGGNTAYVQEGLKRLGIGPERLVAPSNHIQAETLIVPNFAAPFGHPSRDNLQWLDEFWSAQTRISPSTERSARRWFARPGAVRRAVLGETNWSQQLRIHAIQQSSIEEQLSQVARASTLIAPHGAAMANLISAAPGGTVIELVNPAYQPSYFDGLIQRRQLRHKRLAAKATPLPLQEWLYEGPLSYPIDLRPGCSEAAEFLATFKNE